MGPVDELVGGGSLLLGEALPIELANTLYAVRGEPRDGLRGAVGAALPQLRWGEVPRIESGTRGPSTSSLGHIAS